MGDDVEFDVVGDGDGGAPSFCDGDDELWSPFCEH